MTVYENRKIRDENSGWRALGLVVLFASAAGTMFAYFYVGTTIAKLM